MLHVMLVDDEAPLVYLLQRTLERLGYKVSGFTEPDQALRAFDAAPHDFDSVVLDYAMPSKNGFEVAQTMLARRPELPIVMMSGFLRAEDRTRALHLGLRDLVQKPDVCDDLALVLHGLLNGGKTTA